MLTTGKCSNTRLPENDCSVVQAEKIDVMVGFNLVWVGLSLLCPYCKTVLGASIDPIALKTDIVKEITKGRSLSER